MRKQIPLNYFLLCCEVILAFASPLAARADYYWHQVTPAATWEPRYDHEVVVLNDSLLLMGGFSELTPFSESWCSTDGENWDLVTQDAPWGGRHASASVVLGGEVWLLGGLTSIALTQDDVWSSAEGLTWTNVSQGCPWAKRARHTACAFNQELWIMGGRNADGLEQRDVWSSPDGANWTQITDSAAWTKRMRHTSVVFDDSLWVLGGSSSLYSATQSLDDIWRSDDGSEWTQVLEHAPWRSRCLHATVVFDDKLWVIGGADIAGSSIGGYMEPFNDVWCSSDGEEWTQLPDAPWAARWGHAAVVFDDKLWIFGGTVVSGGLLVEVNDIWYLAKGDGGPTIEDRAGWVEAGQPLSLSVSFPAALGSVTYQWYKDGAALADETGETLCIEFTTVDDSGTYWCVASDEAKAAHESNHVEVQIVAQGALPSAGHATLYALAAAVALAGAAVLAARTRRAR